MAIKITIFERCERCGGRNAMKVGDTIVVNHQCPNAPPGPSDPPKRFSANDVVFDPFEFNSALLQTELEAAWLLIGDLRDKRWKAERAVTEAVKNAMTQTYSSQTDGISE